MVWQSAKRLLDDRMRGTPWGRGVAAAMVLERAQEYLGVHLPPEVCGLVRAQFWQRGVLTILVQHPALVHTVRSLQGGLENHIERAAGRRPREVRVFVRDGAAHAPEGSQNGPP